MKLHSYRKHAKTFNYLARNKSYGHSGRSPREKQNTNFHCDLEKKQSELLQYVIKIVQVRGRSNDTLPNCRIRLGPVNGSRLRFER